MNISIQYHKIFPSMVASLVFVVIAGALMHILTGSDKTQISKLNLFHGMIVPYLSVAAAIFSYNWMNNDSIDIGDEFRIHVNLSNAVATIVAVCALYLSLHAFDFIIIYNQSLLQALCGAYISVCIAIFAYNKSLPWIDEKLSEIIDR